MRADHVLPAPCLVQVANDVSGPFLRLGEEELMPGDALSEGEANHHRRHDRGWSYRLSFVTESGALMQYESGFSTQKAEL